MENNFDINTKLSQALAFAIQKHEQFHQTREDGVTPYYVHILRVVERLQKNGADENILVAAALHDVVEDCKVIYEEIRKDFGEKVASYVEEVTIDPNGSQETKGYLEKLRIASVGGKTIKLADKWDNIWELRTKGYKSYGNLPPKDYLDKAKVVLEVCKDGNTDLAQKLQDEITLLENSL